MKRGVTQIDKDVSPAGRRPQPITVPLRAPTPVVSMIENEKRQRLALGVMRGIRVTGPRTYKIDKWVAERMVEVGLLSEVRFMCNTGAAGLRLRIPDGSFLSLLGLGDNDVLLAVNGFQVRKMAKESYTRLRLTKSLYVDVLRGRRQIRFGYVVE